ncbi:MAG: sigma factor-like helix-turn-helix DNA-binding protein [Thermomicrobiales bacterium]
MVQIAWHAGLPARRPAHLTDVEWDVLTRHVGAAEPYVQIARDYGTSIERIRQIAVRATRRLQRHPALTTTDLVDLPGPVARLLLRAGYRTRADIARAADGALLALPGMGLQHLAEVRASIPRSTASLALPDESYYQTVHADYPATPLTLAPDERALLEATHDAATTTRERDRCAAVLQVADGQSPAWVAAHGLSQPRHHAVVYGWLRAYARGGLAKLLAGTSPL